FDDRTPDMFEAFADYEGPHRDLSGARAVEAAPAQAPELAVASVAVAETVPHAAATTESDATDPYDAHAPVLGDVVPPTRTWQANGHDVGRNGATIAAVSESNPAPEAESWSPEEDHYAPVIPVQPVTPVRPVAPAAPVTPAGPTPPADLFSTVSRNGQSPSDVGSAEVSLPPTSFSHAPAAPAPMALRIELAIVDDGRRLVSPAEGARPVGPLEPDAAAPAAVQVEVAPPRIEATESSPEAVAEDDRVTAGHPQFEPRPLPTELDEFADTSLAENSPPTESVEAVDSWIDPAPSFQPEPIQWAAPHPIELESPPPAPPPWAASAPPPPSSPDSPTWQSFEWPVRPIAPALAPRPPAPEPQAPAPQATAPATQQRVHEPLPASEGIPPWAQPQQSLDPLMQLPTAPVSPMTYSASPVPQYAQPAAPPVAQPPAQQYAQQLAPPSPAHVPPAPVYEPPAPAYEPPDPVFEQSAPRPVMPTNRVAPIAQPARAAAQPAVATQNDLWFLSTEPDTVTADDAHNESATDVKEPSPLMTVGLTVGMAVLVIVLVLVFIQLMTSLLR
ncbi:MAG: hypothetical protein ABIP53_05260, partial [Candidatus Limnocylindrales bacterium]